MFVLNCIIKLENKWNWQGMSNNALKAWEVWGGSKPKAAGATRDPDGWNRAEEMLVVGMS